MNASQEGTEAIVYQLTIFQWRVYIMFDNAFLRYIFQFPDLSVLRQWQMQGEYTVPFPLNSQRSQCVCLHFHGIESERGKKVSQLSQTAR